MDAHQYLYEENFAEYGTAYKDAYDNAIKWTDYNVASLVSALDEEGLFEKTIIVIGSDHGEAFLEHSREGHAQDLYAEVVNVPLILSLPFRLDPGIVVEPLVRNIDLWPTVLDLLGLPAQQDAEGRSLVPLIEASAHGGPPDGDAPSEAFAYLDRTWGKTETPPKPLVALDEGGLRLIYPAYKPESAAIYDKREDPGEQRDLSVTLADQKAAMTERVRAYLERKPSIPSVVVEMDEMQLDQLRALGYVLEGKDEKPTRKEGEE
jgi:arylsulfatase A-like enzyme